MTKATFVPKNLSLRMGLTQYVFHSVSGGHQRPLLSSIGARI